MHRNHPQTQLSGFGCQLPEATALETFDCPKTILEILVFSATQHDPAKWPHHRPLARSIKDPSDRIVHRASEPSLSRHGGFHLAEKHPSQTHGCTTGLDQSSVFSRQFADRSPRIRQKPAPTQKHTRPETHQNLINSYKEQHAHPQQGRAHTRRDHAPGTLCPGHDPTEFGTFRDT
jgi:hypothetical protein